MRVMAVVPADAAARGQKAPLGVRGPESLFSLVIPSDSAQASTSQHDKRQAWATWRTETPKAATI